MGIGDEDWTSRRGYSRPLPTEAPNGAYAHDKMIGPVLR